MKKSLIESRDILALENARYTPEYCINLFHTERYFFDMRFWEKPHKEITVQDIVNWIKSGCYCNNCGHLTWIISKAIMEYGMSVQFVAEELFKNKNIEYPNNVAECYSQTEKLGLFARFTLFSINDDLVSFLRRKEVTPIAYLLT